VAERVLIDTGPIVTLLSARDAHHRRCGDATRGLDPPLLTCWPVVTEAAWLLRARPEAVAKLFEGFDGGLFALLPLDADDLPPIAALLRRYRSSGLQLADAALAHLADREGIRTLFTLDRRDFSILRLRRNRALRLIPDLP
jgi:predicted nucleic acid-binding protein